MKKIATQDAVGFALCHDLTQIIVGEGGAAGSKCARFRRGQVISADDVATLLAMGKKHLFVYDEREAAGMMHEEDAAAVLAGVVAGTGVAAGAPSEGKIELKATTDGFLQVDAARLFALNMLDDMMVSTRVGGFVRAGEVVAAMRVVPLFVREAQMREVREKFGRGGEFAAWQGGAGADDLGAGGAAGANSNLNAFGGSALVRVLPFRAQNYGLVITGSEVYNGVIADKFAPLVQAKAAAFGLTQLGETIYCDDDETMISRAICELKAAGAGVIFATGGMSVDADDVTPKAIAACAAEVVSYGTPVLPGAMLMLAYFADGTPILGLPGGVVYGKKTALEALLPQVLAGVRFTRSDIKRLGYGGLLY